MLFLSTAVILATVATAAEDPQQTELVYNCNYNLCYLFPHLPSCQTSGAILIETTICSTGTYVYPTPTYAPGVTGTVSCSIDDEYVSSCSTNGQFNGPCTKFTCDTQYTTTSSSTVSSTTVTSTTSTSTTGTTTSTTASTVDTTTPTSTSTTTLTSTTTSTLDATSTTSSESSTITTSATTAVVSTFASTTAESSSESTSITSTESTTQSALTHVSSTLTSTDVTTNKIISSGSSSSSTLPTNVASSSGSTSSSNDAVAPSGSTAKSTTIASQSNATVSVEETVFTTYCDEPTTFTWGGKTYTVTRPTTLTITSCPDEGCEKEDVTTTFETTIFTTYCPEPTTFTWGDSTYIVTEPTTLTICPEVIESKLVQTSFITESLEYSTGTVDTALTIPTSSHGVTTTQQEITIQSATETSQAPPVVNGARRVGENVVLGAIALGLAFLA